MTYHCQSGYLYTQNPELLFAVAIVLRRTTATAVVFLFGQREYEQEIADI